MPALYNYTACSSQRCSCVKRPCIICGAGCNCNNAPNSTPTHTQFMCEQHLVEEEELVQDMQLREREGDEIVHVNESELLGDVLVVVDSQSEEERRGLHH